MNLDFIKNTLQKEYKKEDINIYIDYLNKLKSDPKKSWFAYKSDTELISYFRHVKRDGFIVDGIHISIQPTGVTYDYIAYKNKMLSIYPETIFDISLVYKDDQFDFKKQSGKIIYTHIINNPFKQREDDIVGGYCVIKNKRGEFLTILNKIDLEKHRKIAKTDKIWNDWLAEMYKKTIVKKACKIHFDDIFQNMETIDNENYDLNLPLEVPIEVKKEIETIKSYEELKKYFLSNKDKYSEIQEAFTKLLSKRRKEIEDVLKVSEETNKNGNN